MFSNICAYFLWTQKLTRGNSWLLNYYINDITIKDYYLPYDGVQYSPGDMAEYIRRTGDDEGVALAVEELMREGLVSCFPFLVL